MSNVSYNFSNKHAVVVGGSYGIGSSIVSSFLKSGCSVSYLSRSKNESSEAIHYKCDIGKHEEIKTVFSKFDKIDFLINVAATNYCKKINEIDLKEWEEVINVNLTSFYLTSKLSIEKMSKGSRIINYSSIAGRNKSIVSGVHYTSSKAGIIGLTRQLAHELGPTGINVNCVCPSQTLSPMLKNSMSDQELENLSKGIPLKRIANCEEQAKISLFLCSSDASYITGAVIDVNGGQL
jgi:3-oxoacyl-[acyl-carrier protein] reductase